MDPRSNKFSSNFVSGVTMREIDLRAQIEFCVLSVKLMENAGHAVFEFLVSNSENIQKEKILIIAGKGNNAGDGFVVARLLLEIMPYGSVDVAVHSGLTLKEGDAKNNFDLLKNKRFDFLSIEELNKQIILDNKYTYIIDAVFGTGFRGELPNSISNIFEFLNKLEHIKRVAIDIPSGLDSNTGIPAENTFKADHTITFGFPKNGFQSSPGKNCCGEIHLADIGFPEKLLNQYLIPNPKI
ncbi:MAG: NAD(P)H-hydrate epimerase [Candidatus Omnitrophica bacterium]|nr:NAD(P)H-hydrate epimerase [Candidatus Omnitrophota bacterium]